MNEFQNALATNPLTGSKFAAEQVSSNPVYAGLFGKGGQLEGTESRLNDLENQGFELKPEDYTAYGQTSGNLARMFGAQGNQISQDLASRGLASAPSGAAGAMFSGLAGNQNEALAKSQQDLLSARVKMTMDRIGQEQNFMSQLGGQYTNALSSQYSRQLSGSQNQHQNLTQAAGLQQGANQQQNQYGLDKAGFDASHTPVNAFDYIDAGAGSALYKGASNSGSMFSGSTPSGGNEPPAGMTGPKQPGKNF